MSGATSLYVRTAGDFLQLLSSVIEELRRQLDANNRPQVRMLLHTLKGNAGTLGITALAREASRLEQLCSTALGIDQCIHQMDSLQECITHAQELLTTAIEMLKSEVPDRKVTSVKDIQGSVSQEELIVALRTLKSLLEASDMQALQNFADVRELLMTIPGDLVDQLDISLQSLDMECAHKVCIEALQLLGVSL
jgi:HPt (histidine-containing phosphotransfer) domain-containing protein